MNAITLIGAHLDQYKGNLNIPIYEFPDGMECAFTQEIVMQACKLKDVLSSVFSEWQYVRGKSGYVSVQAALAIREVIPSSNKDGIFNSLRSYSYFATAQQFKILKRDELLDTLLNLPAEPFVFAVSFNSKKHTTYKASLAQSNESFAIATDVAASVAFEMDDVRAILPTMQKWYSVLPNKELSEQSPTWFTKDDILNGCKDLNRINAYGLDKYNTENELLQPYRNTHFLKVLTFMLNKS